MVDISLIPKEREVESPKEQKEKKPAEIKAKGIFPGGFLAIGILIVVLAGAVTLGVFIYRNMLSSNLSKLENQIVILKAEELKYVPMENAAKTLQSQLNNIDNLINKHKYWSGVIKVLADYTPITVSYKSIECEDINNKFTVTGYADNYQSLANLMVSLKKVEGKEFFDTIELDSAKLSTDEKEKGKVEFSVSFNLKPGSLIQTQPISSSPKNKSTSDTTEDQTKIVTISNKGFQPSEITVTAGTEVTFTNNDTTVHKVTGTSFDSGNINPGKSYKYIFKQKGTYDYQLSDNPNFKVKIIVQ
jgi:plastocyanin